MRRSKISGGADYIIPGALVIGGGFLLYELFKDGGPFSSLFQTGLSQNNKATTDSTSAGQTQTAKDLAAAGVTPTLTQTQLSSIANTVFSLGTQDPPDYAGMNAQLTQINNIADLNAIAGYFGTRSVNASLSAFSACYTMGFDCTQMSLNQFINLLDTGDAAIFKENLNLFLSEQNINYQF